MGLTPANLPEASVTDDLIGVLKGQSVSLLQLHIDRVYLASNLVKERSEDLSIVCTRLILMSSCLLNYANLKRLQPVVRNCAKDFRWSIPSAQVSQWQGNRAR